MNAYQEPIAFLLVGFLLSVSAGVRAIIPLLGLSIMAYEHKVQLPPSLEWIGSPYTLLAFSVAFITETVAYFVPVVGTTLKALATPLATVAGTLLMACPLEDLHNPIAQWTLAALLGGGLSTLTHLGVTGGRAAATPADAVSVGLAGVIINILELAASWFLTFLAGCAVLWTH